MQQDTSERGHQAHFVMQSHQQRRCQHQLCLEPFQKNCEFLYYEIEKVKLDSEDCLTINPLGMV
ncbi:hypothetical protein DJ557_03550 [Streptococcus pyogenes]|nr:hypothetical protein DJ557_03550 [Streptococcus pyogenes]